MLTLMRYAFFALARFLIPLRYRIHVRGMETLKGLKGPVLVLPNHPGYVDPIILFMLLWPRLKMRPMVYGSMFASPFLRWVKTLIQAHEVPDVDRTSTQARVQAERTVTGFIEGLRSGDNHILWPAGHAWRDGVERIGAARAAADILRAVPEAHVILVRTHGVWGSSFTWAWGGQPNLTGCLLAGIGWLLVNLLFFMPRRKVEITIERIDRSALPELTREMLNPWLERWYNREGPENPTYVPYHFLSPKRTHDYPSPSASPDVSVGQIKPETKEAIRQILADKFGQQFAEGEQMPETTLDHLGLDSLDRMEVALEVERRFGVTSERTPKTLGELWVLAEGRGETTTAKPIPPEWFRAPPSGKIEMLSDTIPSAFLARALLDRTRVAVADDESGVLTYEQLLVAVLLLSRRFARLPGPNVGLLLPASVGCDVALLALIMAGKLPVVLNWTTGPANLAHAVKVMRLTHVVTSRLFIDRTALEVPGTEFLFLEDMRKEIGFFEKVRTLFQVRFLPLRVRQEVPVLSPHQPAVVLFTSGSEKAPKAVPLTHENILSSAKLGPTVMGVTRQDVLLSFLPAFHSFGMTVTGLLPLLGGMRVVHHPDPADAGGLTRKAISYRTTVMVGTPTFISHILERAKPEELSALRLIIVGAEKCPLALFDLCARVVPQAHLVEGYGVTECSPVVSVNPPAEPRPGSIGKPLPGIEVRVVDLDTGLPLPEDRMGMMQVSGPIVFPGYIAHEGPSPFVDEDGKRWYVTGDLGEFDAEGYLWFKGRLKRFLKAGGEMISLPTLEEPFAKRFPPTDEGPVVAVEGVEREEGRLIVLFTTRPISLRDANALLIQEGFHGVMRLDEVRQVDKIPMLGTGKTDYKVLRARLQSTARRPQVLA